jgi:hypothetical protein
MLRYPVLGVLALTATCADYLPTDGPLSHSARVRFVNLITDEASAPVNAYLDGQPFGDSLEFGETSPLSIPPFTSIYREVNYGQHTVVLRKTADTSQVVGSYSFIVPAPPPEGVAEFVASNDVAEAAYPGGYERDRTVVATVSGFASFQFPDRNAPPDAGTIRVRVINLSTVASSVDVFVTDATADLTVAVPSATNVRLGGDPPYFAVPAGTWRVRAVRTGTAPANRVMSNVVLNISPLLWDKGARTIVLVDNPANLSFTRGTVIVDQ